MIKIGYCDMYHDFDPEDNILTNMVRKHFEDVVVSGQPEFLFYGPFGTRHYFYNDCVKIFYTGEAVAPDFNQCDYAIGFDPIQFGDRYLRRPLWIDETMPTELTMSDEEALNRKFCNFIYSNDTKGKGSRLRKELAKKLMKYKPVDCPGKVLNNMSSDAGNRLNDWRRNKVNFISQYKFTIAFENSAYTGYTTEKKTQPLSAHSVPVYWGNPDVYKDFNREAFICANGMEDDLDRLVEQIIALDRDDENYLKMIHAKPMSDSFNENEMDDMEQFLVSIIERGNVPVEKDPLSFAKRMSVDSLSRKEKIRYFLLK